MYLRTVLIVYVSTPHKIQNYQYPHTYTLNYIQVTLYTDYSRHLNYREINSSHS